MIIKGESVHLRKKIPVGSCCEKCEWGINMSCTHWNDIHYNIYGEGIESPDYCPQTPFGLPFGREFDPVILVIYHGSQIAHYLRRMIPFFRKHKLVSERAEFLKNEYGVGGFGGHHTKTPCTLTGMSCNAKGIKYDYIDEDGNDIREKKLSYSDLAKGIGKLVDPYLSRWEGH